MFPVVAVDFGGTHIRTALFPTENPEPVQQMKVKTLAEEGFEAVFGRIKAAIQDILPEEIKEIRIGIASPGPVNPFTGMVYKTPNLPGWKDVPLCELISTTFKCPVVINNDANLAALGEWKHGAGKRVNDLLYLTISTGIGAGIITEGQLLLGVNGLAGELGHMTVEPGGPICGCGQSGHIEAIASGPSIARIAEHRLRSGEASLLSDLFKSGTEIEPEQIGQAAKQGDALALSVIENAGKAIGSHLASLVHAFNPALIVIGGGVSQLGDLFFGPIRRTLEAEILHPAYLQNLEVRPAELGDDAGLIGAMVYARQT